MSQITLNTPVEITPAQQAVTTTSVTVLEVRENYGWNYSTTPNPDGIAPNYGPGRPQSVEATILLGDNAQRTLTVWEGDAYLAVRGSWTDEDLAARITQLLAG
jgi:hypothetical protein